MPLGYLRVLVFNKDSALVSTQTQQVQLSQLANGGYEALRVSVPVAQDGYVTAYVGNESDVDVYFDDVTVEHRQGLQVQENQYDPWGLSLAGLDYSSPGIRGLNQYQFNSKERQLELGLGWLDYGARYYDPARGPVWYGVDPLADKMRRWSPYAFCFGNAIRFVDVDGMSPGDFYNENGKKIGTDGKEDGRKYVVKDSEEADAIARTSKQGGTTQVDELNSAELLPSNAALKESLNVLDRTRASTDKDPTGGMHGESSFVMGDGTVVRGASGDKAFVNDKNELQANETLPSVPAGSGNGNVDAAIHSHVTGYIVQNDQVYSHNATVPSAADNKTLSQYSTNIIVGPLSQVHQIPSLSSSPSVPAFSHPATGIVIYGIGASIPHLILTESAVRRIIK